MHTPAPWMVDSGGGLDSVAVVADRNGVAHGCMAILEIHSVRCPLSRSTQIENARLMAAAPELLEALEAISQAFERHKRSSVAMRLVEIRELQELANEAIAKATT